jgi:hypothetical protein
MPTANFNTTIYSSKIENEEKFYSLDDVIDKDFEGPYRYTLNSDEVPVGTNIKDGNTLIIPPNATFNLDIVVTDTDKINVATANTEVILEPSPFEVELQSFLDNSNLQQNLSTTKSDWTTIINRNTNDKV